MLRLIKSFAGIMLASLAALRVSAAAGRGDASKAAIVNSMHDFSVKSRAATRSTSDQRVCVFCHSPHDANPKTPLWNHAASNAASYGLYGSSTLKAAITQPAAADSSKLCLSCHDGTVALGDTIADGVIPFVQGSDYALPASSPANLNGYGGFSDDHPFAFNPVTGPEIQNPPGNDAVKLDPTGKLQCVTCHDPHVESIDKTAGKFLVKANARSALCLTCHKTAGWANSSHQQPANIADDSRYTSVQGAHTGYSGVANNGCESCHRPHTAGSGERLLKFEEENVCYPCHDGSVADPANNIQAEFQTKIYRHPVSTTPSVHDAAEGPSSALHRMPETSVGVARHAECPDCHNAHAAGATPARAPAVNGFLRGVSGVTEAGAGVAAARNEYEVCFKCHADSANKPQSLRAGPLGIGYGRSPLRQTHPRVPDPFNTRVAFGSYVSWHPVTKARGLSTGLAGEIPSLRPYVITSRGQPMMERPLSAVSVLYCSDCHNNDTGRNLGDGSGPAGPHGSNQPHLLERPYAYNLPPAQPGAPLIPVGYSSSAYGICNKCHDLDNSIMQDQSFKEHRRHIQTDGASCAVCHDSHGVSGGNILNNRYLINFDTAIVGPSSKGMLRYESTGSHRGRCYLTCHGADHNPESY